ncbi:hypothetical protein PIROE2DRAFT_6180 [Piromyces sp. E2]|nr:hypothetical protein PIROE2DRAFT_6180 [Piromyces sp. E2]|eukprot:OUM66559.1 hypothetical protein PIROE2DRAFT_6180 [Piromyces sp. E2]
MTKKKLKDFSSCTVRVSTLPNKLNEIKERSNIKFDRVVTTKLSHESLMLSFNEFLTSGPVYGTNVKFLCPTTSAFLITCSFQCLCSALSICSSLKAKVPPRRNVIIAGHSKIQCRKICSPWPQQRQHLGQSGVTLFLAIAIRVVFSKPQRIGNDPDNSKIKVRFLKTYTSDTC